MTLIEPTETTNSESEADFSLNNSNPYRNHRELTITEIKRLQQSVDETYVVYGEKNPVRRKTA